MLRRSEIFSNKNFTCRRIDDTSILADLRYKNKNCNKARHYPRIAQFRNIEVIDLPEVSNTVKLKNFGQSTGDG